MKMAPEESTSTPSSDNTSLPGDSRSQNLAAALSAADIGLPVFPVRVTRGKNGRKATTPLVKWRKTATTDTEQIRKWWKNFPDAVPGVATGEVFVVDLDKGDGKDGEAAYRALGLDPDDAAEIIRTPSGGRHLYFDGKGAEGLTISQTAAGLDTRGRGGFVFAPGARTIFGDYEFEKGGPLFVKHGFLLPVPGVLRAALTKPGGGGEAVSPAPGGHDIDRLKDALSFIPNNGPYDEWVRILMD